MDLEYFKESKNGVTVTVTDDPCPVDPREVWAYDFYADLVDAKTQFPVFFIAAWHRRYEFSYRLPFQLKNMDDFNEFMHTECDNPKSHWKFLPLYMYEHGGIALSLNSFNDTFDSGQLGFIVYNDDPDNYEKGGPILNENEVKIIVDEWFKYEQNGAYWYTITDDVDGEILSQNAGYYNLKQCKEDAIEEWNNVVDSMPPVVDRIPYTFITQFVDITDSCNTILGKMRRVTSTIPEFAQVIYKELISDPHFAAAHHIKPEEYPQARITEALRKLIQEKSESGSIMITDIRSDNVSIVLNLFIVGESVAKKID